MAGTERNDLDRQRELADGVHNLGLVHDPHDLVGVGGHDLLPQQSSAAALDAVEVLVDFVGAVNGHVDVVHVVDVHDLDAVAFSLDLRAARRGYASELKTFLLMTAAELVHQELHGRTSAEACDHAVFNELGGFDAGRLLQRILLCLIHGFSFAILASAARINGVKPYLLS